MIQRIIASHAHDLILSKIRNQGIDSGDNPICLSCSLGSTIIDLIVHKNDPFPELERPPYGTTHMEQVEQRPLDMYDLSSILYLCQQNLTDSIFRRYSRDESEADKHQPTVSISTTVGDYEVGLGFHLVSTDVPRSILPPGNASASTIHQVLPEDELRHRPELILKDLEEVGLSVNLEKIHDRFSLSRYINNTTLSMHFVKKQ